MSRRKRQRDAANPDQKVKADLSLKIPDLLHMHDNCGPSDPFPVSFYLFLYFSQTILITNPFFLLLLVVLWIVSLVRSAFPASGFCFVARAKKG